VPGLARIYSEVSANPVAAIPSLHAAMPMLVFLFSLKIWGRRALPIALYPLFMLWSIVYTGHHYVVDWMVGVAYAGAVYYALSGHPYEMLLSAARPLRQRHALSAPEEATPQRKAA
jgi:membrane-associated phospholipid phosphatase